MNKCWARHFILPPKFLWRVKRLNGAYMIFCTFYKSVLVPQINRQSCSGDLFAIVSIIARGFPAKSHRHSVPWRTGAMPGGRRRATCLPGAGGVEEGHLTPGRQVARRRPLGMAPVRHGTLWRCDFAGNPWQ